MAESWQGSLEMLKSDVLPVSRPGLTNAFNSLTNSSWNSSMPVNIGLSRASTAVMWSLARHFVSWGGISRCQFPSRKLAESDKTQNYPSAGLDCRRSIVFRLTVCVEHDPNQDTVCSTVALPGH